MRALTEAGAGAWSEPLLFETPGVPSEDEVRQALDTLRRYRDGRDGDVGEGLAPSLLRSDEPRAPAIEARRSPPTNNNQQPTTGPGGGNALTAPTVGSGPSPQAVIAPSSFSLTLDGGMELGGFVFKGGVPFLHNIGGSRNTALGLSALVSATPDDPEPGSGESNSAFGNQALRFNTSGFDNTAVGNTAMRSNTTGHDNTAVGEDALFSNTTGLSNTAVGEDALLLPEGEVSPLEYGLIAEEVAKIFPELVLHDDEGKPYTVRYHLLTPLLLAEIQRQEGEISAQSRQLESVLRQIEGRDR